ncbi:type II secretion system protein N [Alcanivorax sp. DP30]|uniref:type II secretion system protein N n=1 Tax=Alcanivorax sp. DP30 TaxID=2606217 RepID=UPI00136E74F0|nr:type II secretion system protein N [Alcanivorax sp. DP30]MZR61315.1 type II secretion system protein GspN [Alcanivorax sp. DP30]
MPRKWILALLFVVSLTVFLVILMPAAVLIERVPALRPGGAPLVLESPRGPWWNAQVNWRWQQHQGVLDWQLDWHGLTPGLNLAARTTRGDEARIKGWLGGSGQHDWSVEQLRLALPVALIAERIPQGNADGRVDATVMALAVSDGQIEEARATLQYSGGTVTWGNNGSATVPVLQGKVSMDSGVPTLVVTDPDNTLLLNARLEEGRFNLAVMRAWPQLLGVSKGGNADDVVFQMSQPFTLIGGRAK